MHHSFSLYTTGLNVTCLPGAVAGRQTFSCSSTNRLVSVMCSFDGGPAESCSFPLVVEIGRFGTDDHTVLVTVIDEFGQSLDVMLSFTLIPSKQISSVQVVNLSRIKGCSFVCDTSL